MRAEHHADADLPGALGTTKREQAVQPERRQQQADDREPAGDEREQPFAREASDSALSNVLNARDGEIRVEAVNRRDRGVGDGGRLIRSHEQRHARLVHLAMAVEDRRLRSSRIDPSLTLPTTPMIGA